MLHNPSEEKSRHRVCVANKERDAGIKNTQSHKLKF